jgi:hypothetical protein
MPRLVCVVEGHGEVESLPILCVRILHRLEAYAWSVDKNPIRQPRSRLVNETVPSPNRDACVDGLTRAIALAQGRPADGVLVICDSDDDCAAVWGPSASQIVQNYLNGGVVMVVREYESWLIASRLRKAAIGTRPVEGIRGAKEYLRQITGHYRPSQHQAQFTRQLDIDVVWALSDSFDKLVRTIAAIAGVAVPDRPALTE